MAFHWLPAINLPLLEKGALAKKGSPSKLFLLRERLAHPSGSPRRQLLCGLFLTGESLTFWLGGTGSTSFSCTRKRQRAPLPSSPGPPALPKGGSAAPLTRNQGPPHQGEESLPPSGGPLWASPLPLHSCGPLCLQRGVSVLFQAPVLTFAC